MAMAISINTAQTSQADRSACLRGGVLALLLSSEEWLEGVLPSGRVLACGSGDDVGMGIHSFMTNSRPDCEPT